MGLQVREVRMVRMMKVVKVKPQAERVPLGMDLAGATSSPDKLAPAMIPEQFMSSRYSSFGERKSGTGQIYCFLSSYKSSIQ